jgi:acetolactate synthase-1/2/3 large subunit
VLVGQVETEYLGRESFQEIDLPRFYSEITKWAVTAERADRIPELVHRALQIATTGRPGPVMIAVPSDILQAEIDGATGGWEPGVRASSPPVPEDGALARLALEMTSSRRPVIIAGGGAQGARDELIAVAERFGAGVYAAFRRQDVFPNDHPNYCGHLTIGTPSATLEALRSADLVVVVGSRLSEITTQRYSLPHARQRVIQIDIEPRVIGAVHFVDLGMVADSKATLGRLARLGPGVSRDWSQAHAAFLASSLPERHELSPIRPETVMAELSAVFGASTIVTTDAGNFTVYAHRFWRFTEPRTQLSPTSGAMGYGIPAGVAAALACPGREVLTLVGDGGFMMTGQELEVAVRLGLHLTIVVFRNGLYGTIALHQARHMGRLAAVDIGPVDIATVAAGYGARSWTVTSPAQLRKALGEATSDDAVGVIDVITDRNVLTPDANLDQILVSQPDK